MVKYILTKNLIEYKNMVEIGKKPPSARPEDYIEIQGGVPSIEKQGKLSVVIHDYEGGDGMEVRGKNIKKYGTVDLTLSNGEVRRFQVGLLRQFHDEPCEGQSRRLGGEGYDRR